MLIALGLTITWAMMIALAATWQFGGALAHALRYEVLITGAVSAQCGDAFDWLTTRLHRIATDLEGRCGL